METLEHLTTVPLVVQVVELMEKVDLMVMEIHLQLIQRKEEMVVQEELWVDVEPVQAVAVQAQLVVMVLHLNKVEQVEQEFQQRLQDRQLQELVGVVVKVKLVELEQEEQVVAVLLVEHCVMQEIQEQLTQVVAVDRDWETPAPPAPPC